MPAQAASSFRQEDGLLLMAKGLNAWPILSWHRTLQVASALRSDSSSPGASGQIRSAACRASLST
jgi:hypothetical protein